MMMMIMMMMKHCLLCVAICCIAYWSGDILNKDDVNLHVYYVYILYITSGVTCLLFDLLICNIRTTMKLLVGDKRVATMA